MGWDELRYRPHITRFDIVFKSDPFSPQSLDSLDQVQQVLVAATRRYNPLHGTTEVGLAGTDIKANCDGDYLVTYTGDMGSAGTDIFGKRGRKT